MYLKVFNELKLYYRNKQKTKTMKGRVVIKQSSSELVMVEVQYNVYNEEHPGVTNRNHKESRLSRSQTVIIGNVY